MGGGVWAGVGWAGGGRRAGQARFDCVEHPHRPRRVRGLVLIRHLVLAEASLIKNAGDCVLSKRLDLGLSDAPPASPHVTLLVTPAGGTRGAPWGRAKVMGVLGGTHTPNT